MVKFTYTILYVKDVAKSITFYEQAFGFVRKFITPDNSYGELLTGETTISFATIDLANSNLSAGFTESNPEVKPFGIELGFATADVQITVDAAISAGAILVEDLKVKPWGQSVAYVRDIDGFLIEICTPMS
jgi:lactoylglutathione lyase